MDELQIEGKRYISSRRAAKENKYHADYIGQLIRTGKIAGRKVGRTWYVGADSLKNYLSQGGDTLRQEEPVVEAVAEEMKEENVVAAIEEAPIEKLEEPPVSPVVKIEEQRVEQKIATPASVFSDNAERIPVQKKSSNLTYLEDDEPMLPTLEERANADFISIPMRRIASTELEPTEETEPEQRNQRKNRMHMVPAFVFAGGLILAAVAIGSNFVASSIVVAEGQPAIVGFTLK